MKTLKYMLTFVITLLFIAVPAIIFLVKFQNTIPLGKLVKSKLIRFPFFISTINLNEPGDGRYIYISPTSSSIKVNLAYDQNIVSNEQLPLWIQQMVTDTTGKQVDIKPTSTSLLSQDTYTINNLNAIKSRLPHSSPSDPVLNIVYLTTFQEKPSYAGITLHRDTIFIFKNTLKELTPKTQELADFERSTVLHEWGHLLGMEHNDFANCVMSTEVEVNVGSQFKKNAFPTSFCWNELYELTSIRNH